MSAKRLISLCAVNSSSKAAYTIVYLPSLFSVLPELVWLRITRRVLFRNDFILFKFIFLKFLLQFFLVFF